MEKKKKFSSSWFYEEQSNVYPSIEEQVEMCRKIASQLINEENKESKGASMFNKRVKRSVKWVTPQLPQDQQQSEQQQQQQNLVRKDPPKLKLILDPRQLKSIEVLKKSGVNVVEHNAVSPDICHSIVQDLLSPDANKSKGAQIFMKRREKSENWVVDENELTEKIKQEKRKKEIQQQQQQQQQQPMQQPKLKLIQSPWDAALTTGNVENAFQVTTKNPIVQSILDAANNKQKQLYYSSLPRGWQPNTNVDHCKVSENTENENWRNSRSIIDFTQTSNFQMPQYRNFNTVPRGFKRVD